MRIEEIKTFLISLLDFFLPRTCVHCNVKLSPSEKHICSGCFSQIKLTDNEFIQKEFERKFSDDNLIAGFHSSFFYSPESPIHSLIHKLKYSGNYNIGRYLGYKLFANSYSFFSKHKIDYIIPIPLHRIKKADRGYNQSYYIAKGIEYCSGIKTLSGLVKRNRFTISQTGFSLSDRKKNMEDAFILSNNKLVEGKNFLIVDDVITTGATIKSCAKVLKEKKAKNIFAFSAAIPNSSTSSQVQKLQV